MKVVDLVTRNSDQLSVHFSDFSTNLYRFYKFTALENKKEKGSLFAQRPLDFCFFSGKVPGGLDRTGEMFEWHFPACLLAGGEGDVGEKGEGTECYLLVPRIGSGAACGGGGMERGGRGGSMSPAAARRRGLAGAAVCGGFGRRWGSCWGALFGREMAGEA